MNAIRPIAETAETVTLSRADFDALMEALEDAADLAAARAVQAAVAAGREEYIPFEMVQRLAGDDHPLKVWREYRGLSREELAEAAGVPAEVIAAVEECREPAESSVSEALAKGLRLEVADIIR